MNTLRSRKFAAGMTAFVMAGLFAVSGFAQETASKPDEQVQKMEKFVVTGSLLPQSEAVTANPVIALDSQQLGMSGATDTLDLFRRQTPYFFGNGNIGKEVNNTSDGSHGSSLGESQVALRNLTTLVLLDGRRVVGSPVSSGTAVDVSAIPSAMIDHIEILKDGASTLYGSDAIGGVVNIITKKNYTGFEISARQGFDSSHNYKTEEYSVLGGAASNGMSMVVVANYYRNTPILTTQRPITSLSTTALQALGRAGSPSYMSGRYPGYVSGYLLAGSPLAVGAPGYKASVTSPPVKTDPNAPGVTLASLVASGVYIPISSTPSSIALGGTTGILNTTSFGTYAVDPTSRKQFMANFEKDVFGEKLQFFMNFLYNAEANTGIVLAPGPSGPGSIEVNNMIIPANNPYNFYSQTISSFPGGFVGGVRTRFVDVGNRNLTTNEDTFRVVTGFRGKINEDFSWELGLDYGHANYRWLQNNAINGYSFNAAEVPLLTAAGGYTYDSNGRPLSSLSDSQGNVPIYNYFGLPGSNDPRTIKAIRATLFQSGGTDLKNVDFVIRGTPWSLPAGKVGIALGVEYRGEGLVANVDQLYSSGYLMGGLNPVDDFAGGKTNTKSVFGEVHLPLVAPSQGIPGAYELSLDVSGRHEELNSGAKSNVPKFGLKWQPIDKDISFRATYAKGFSAPSIFSLYGPAQGNSPQVTLVDTATAGHPLSSVQITSSEQSNPALPPSKSKAWTAGMVYSPHQIKGLDISIGYFNIDQDGVGGIDYQGIMNSLNALGSGSPYAPGYRDVNGNRLTSTAANQVTVQTVGQVTIMNTPSGEQKISGYDLEASYRFDLPTNLGTMRVSTLATYLNSYKAKANRSAPYYDYAGYYVNANYALGLPNNTLPDYNIKANLQYNKGNFGALLTANYLPKVGDPADTFAGQSDTNSTTINGKPYTIPSYYTMDLNLGYNIGKRYAGQGLGSLLNGVSVAIGCNNLFNKKPPFIPSSAEDNTDKQTYDIVGRYVFIELKKSF